MSEAYTPADEKISEWRKRSKLRGCAEDLEKQKKRTAEAAR